MLEMHILLHVSLCYWFPPCLTLSGRTSESRPSFQWPAEGEVWSPPALWAFYTERWLSTAGEILPFSMCLGFTFWISRMYLWCWSALISLTYGHLLIGSHNLLVTGSMPWLHYGSVLVKKSLHCITLFYLIF